MFTFPKEIFKKKLRFLYAVTGCLIDKGLVYLLI